jgi:VWFA-related protein
MHKLLTSLLLCGLLVAQQQTPAQQTPPQQAGGLSDEELRILVETNAVQIPVWVYDRQWNYVDGLNPNQFRVFDNGKEQKISGVDVAFAPISMVIVVQANADVEKMLPAVNKIGALIQPHILGDQGEAAVIAYDSRVRVLQPFTHDADQISAAMKKIQPGSTSQHLTDAIFEGTRMLSTRPKDRRRVILLIGEKRDIGSEIRGREALIYMQIHNVTLYSANMSILLTKLSAPPPDYRPPAIPATAMPIPGISATTPTTVAQTFGTQGYGADFLPLLIEIYRDTKAIFKANVVDVYAKGTGGEEFNYYKGRGLEKVIDDIGEVLHSQYTITYTPSAETLKEGGFHQIVVDVLSPKAHSVRVKPGYYLGAK